MASLLLLTDDGSLLAQWKQSAAQFAVHARNALPGRPLAGADNELVLLDADLLRKQKISLTSALGVLPGRRVILADANVNDDDGLSALRAGCSGYCHAYTPPERLAAILDVVQAGEIWAGRDLMLRLLRAASSALPEASAANNNSRDNWREKLTDREAAVAELAAQGLPNKTIADRLDITVRTVKAHLSSSFAKLGVRDRVQLLMRLRGG